ncbi:putative sensor histidine kinase [hydrothermal vent metagenome]|uniref:histidine kinase n=1 Tax=hydrothermal vent metagenome TaxID=652676 RepID=A0A3B0WFI4_9ZZZZ
MVVKPLNLRLSIRTRFFVLLLLLTILPFLAYRFAIDLNRIMLTNQAIIQQQTAKNLALILENRPDLWALQIQTGNPTHLPHLNLSNSVLWVVNAHGATTYVVGQLPDLNHEVKVDFFTSTGKTLIKTLATFIPYSLPYPYPQSKTPELNLIQRAFQGHTIQQYRMDKNQRPISLMAATPLRFNKRVIGTLVLEERMETLFSASLNYFYKMVGIGSIIFLIVIIGAIIHTASLSNRILRLDNDVKKMFNFKGRLMEVEFPDQLNMWYQDELSDLRHHIHEMLQQLGAYERYLKQLPKTLRHELHNPLNRLSMALSLLEKDIQHTQLGYAQHALAQLKQIIASLSEATSIEDSLKNQTPEPFPLGLMLNHYMQNNIDLHPEWNLKYINQSLTDDYMILGDGFMIEQLMDKLMSNAKDFSDGKMPITIKVMIQDEKHLQQKAIITVENSGGLLPTGYEQQIFEGMTSIRTLNQDNHAHLGLGLYIAKLITNYHHGQIYAENFKKDMGGDKLEGVRFVLEFPVFKNT